MISISSILDYWSAGGILLLPLALINFLILYFLVRTHLCASSLRREGRILQRWLANRPQSMDATVLLRELPETSFGGVFQRALHQMDNTQVSPLGAIASVEQMALCCLRRDILLLAALTASAPLVGLLGTVGGMIATFDAVSTISGQTGTRVAGGISQALITTQFGLIVAMPGVFGLAHLRQIIRDVAFLLSDCRVQISAFLGVSRTGLEREGLSA